MRRHPCHALSRAFQSVLLSGAIVAGSLLAVACSTDDDRSNRRSVLSGDDGGDGSSSDAKKKKSSSNRNTGEGPDSLAVFSEVLHPILKQRCGGACHASTFAPFFASDDAAASLDALMIARKVDLNNIPNSRLVLRLSKDKHNYWSDPEADAAEMQAAIEEWAKSVKEGADAKPALPTTAALLLASTETSIIEYKNPPGTFVFEAEQGVVTAPMVEMDVPGASGGKVLHTPAGAGNANNANQARNNNNLGRVSFTIDVAEAGTYTVHGLVNAPAANRASFYILVDNAQALQPWLFGATDMDYVWDIADPVAGVGTPTQLNLTVGMHTIEIRQRQEQAKLDMIAITNDPMFDGMGARPDGSNEVQILTYDISEISGVTGAKFQVEVRDYSENAYLFNNPKIISDKPLRVQDVRLLINGQFLDQHATYTIINKTVAPPGEVLLPAALVALKDKGADMDEFSFSFGIIEVVE